MMHKRPSEFAFNDDAMTLGNLLRVFLQYRFLAGFTVAAFILSGVLYLLVSEPVYEASGDLLVESSGSPLFADTAGEKYDKPVPAVSINDVLVKINGAGITDSVIVKTAAFVTIGIPREYYARINSFAAVPPPRAMRFSVVPSRIDRGGFLVIPDQGGPALKGTYNRPFVSERFSLTLSNMRPLKNFDIVLEPVVEVRARMARKIRVANVRDSNVIHISCTAPEPARAKTIVNAYLNEVTYRDLIEKRAEATTLRLFLENQYRTVASSIESAENGYLTSRISTGIVSLDEQTRQFIDLMRFLEERRIDYEIKLEEATVSKEKATAILKGDTDLRDYSRYASSPFMESNPILQELYSRIATLQVDNARMKSRYNASHPLVLQSNTELDAAKKQLELAISSTVNNATKGIDPLLRPVVESQLSSNINIHVYRQLLSRIKGEIAGLNKTLEKLPKSEIDKVRYDRTIGINSQIHDLLLTRLEEARIMEASTISDIKVINWAEIPDDPVSPRKSRVILLALFAGMLFSGMLIILIEHFKPSFGSAETVESTVGAPVLALIPRLSERGGSLKRQVLVHAPGKDSLHPFNVMEVYNAMLVNLLSSGNWTDQKTLVVSSTFAGEGKSVISANLAVMMAKSGKRVLLIDSDFRRPVQHTIFGVPNTHGFIDLIRDGSSAGFFKTRYPNLVFLPAGKAGDCVISELFHNPNLAESITRLESGFDTIIIDSPPLMLYADAVALASRFRNVLLVIKSGTAGVDVLKSKKALDQVNAKIAGIVVNDVKKSLLTGYSCEEYEYGYGYGYGYGYKEAKKEASG